MTQPTVAATTASMMTDSRPTSRMFRYNSAVMPIETAAATALWVAAPIIVQ